MSLRVFAPFLLIAVCSCDTDGDYKQRIAASFKDPASVHFGTFKKVGNSICGSVNAKNGFGGYVGFRPFMAAVTPSGPIEPDFGPERIMTEAELKIAVDIDRDACAYGKAHNMAPDLKCSMEAADREKFAASERWLAKLRACGEAGVEN